MDVSDRALNQAMNQNTSSRPELIRQLVALTGLPEHLAYRELDRILEMTGQKSDDVKTLDDLRGPMIAYLESLQHEDLDEGVCVDAPRLVD